MRCVLPKPTPPYKNSGLNVTSPPSATRFDAAYASSFGFPTINVSKVNRASIGALVNSDEKPPFFAALDFGVSWRVGVSSGFLISVWRAAT